ncbi:MAG: hypothetical protein K0Q55_680 [Verrucomicrobia bacterium]|jgi:hypothetical protein|nr:hypothetical protein [Verrucomicrobiota bacterium]
MSLINDALKRANEAQKNRPVAGPLGAPLQPADAPMRRGNNSGTNWSPVLIPAIIVVLLALGFWFIRSGLQNKPSQQPVVAVTTPVPPPAVVAPSAPVPAPAPVAPKTPEKPVPYIAKSGVKVSTEVVTRELPPEPAFEPTPMKIEVPAPTPATVPAVAIEPKTESVVAVAPTPQPPVAKVEPATPPQPVFPEVKLQGIFYRLNNPTALISSKNVHVGDLVMGAKVVAIERASVTLEFKGERKVLTLDVQ